MHEGNKENFEEKELSMTELVMTVLILNLVVQKRNVRDEHW